jgi:type II secretory pathway component PulF
MKKPKYTAGPWSFKLQKRLDSDVSSLASFTCGWVQSETDAEAEANAALISAAPEMLEALELIAKHFQYPELRKVTGQNRDGTPSSVSIEMIMSTVEKIADAIRKAKGE